MALRWNNDSSIYQARCEGLKDILETPTGGPSIPVSPGIPVFPLIPCKPGGPLGPTVPSGPYIKQLSHEGCTKTESHDRICLYTNA